MSRKKEEAPSLREKIKTFQRNLKGDAAKKFTEVFCEHTKASCFKEGLAYKNVHAAYSLAKKAIVGLPGSEPEPEKEED